MNTEEQEQKTIETYDSVAENWASHHETINDWEQELAHLSDFAPVGHILDVGCGSGRDAELLLDLGYSYTGIDASSGLLAVARKRLPTADFRQLNLYDLTSLDGTYDSFISIATLLHIPRTQIGRALRSINSVLNNNAAGLITLKDGEGEEFEIREVEGRHEERLFVYWHKENFESVLSVNGFIMVDYFFRHIGRSNWHGFYVKKTQRND